MNSESDQKSYPPRSFSRETPNRYPERSEKHSAVQGVFPGGQGVKVSLSRFEHEL